VQLNPKPETPTFSAYYELMESKVLQVQDQLQALVRVRVQEQAFLIK